MTASGPLSPLRPTASSRRRHVLLVDDYEDRARHLLRHVLEQAGMLVSEAAFADEALAIIGSSSVDVVITDVSLRGRVRDGVWLLSRLRATPHGRNIPVIALTGQQERERELAEMGFAAVVIKPIERLQDLIGIVHRVDRP